MWDAFGVFVVGLLYTEGVISSVLAVTEYITDFEHFVENIVSEVIVILGGWIILPLSGVFK